MFRNYLRAAASVATLTLLLSACGGSDAGGQGSASASAPSSGSAGSPPAASTPTTPVNVPTNSPAAPPTNTPSTPPVTPAARSAKRGVAYDLADPLDFAALSSGVSWRYNWSSHPNKMRPADYVPQYGNDYYH